METLKDFLWPIVAIGALGALIDFLIGTAGQEKAKDFLLKWWVRFDDVHWKNFGQQEGLFAGNLIDKWLGVKFFSFKRIVISLLAFLAFLLLWYIIIPRNYVKCFLCTNTLEVMWRIRVESHCEICHYLQIALTFFIYFVSFSISVTFTRWVTVKTAHLCGISEARNLLIFIGMLLINYTIFVLWYPITEINKDAILWGRLVHERPVTLHAVPS
jgi:hypothetical protein